MRRLWDDDARLVLKALPEASLDRLFLMFPDPLPKARHAKRRFVHPHNLALVARAPKPGAGPMERGPDVPGRVVPGSCGTFAGVRADARARALDPAGHASPGLWVAGADQASVMGGHYPSGGINLGPAMTFG